MTRDDFLGRFEVWRHRHAGSAFADLGLILADAIFRTSDPAESTKEWIGVFADVHRRALAAEAATATARVERDAARAELAAHRAGTMWFRAEDVRAAVTSAVVAERESCAVDLENDAHFAPGIGKCAAAVVRARGKARS